MNSNTNLIQFNYPSSGSIRGKYNGFNELVNIKNSTNFDIPNFQNDLKSCNNRNEDLYEIQENSAEITDLASSRIENNFTTLNNNNSNNSLINNAIGNNDNSNILINISNQINLEDEISNDKKKDTYDSLFSSISNTNNFNYCFEELNDNNENLDFNNLRSNNEDITNENNNKKAVKTVDILTKEFMNRKMNINQTIRKDLKDNKISNLKKIIQSHQKNNY